MADSLRLFIEFGENLALLIALTFLYSLILRRLRSQRNRVLPLMQGLLFGAIAILGMMVPMHVAEGVIVDGRVVIVLLASPYAGRLAGLVAGLMAVGFRIHLGGVGMIAGSGAIVTAMIAGMLFAARFNIRSRKIGVKQLLIMALTVTPLSLLWVFALPDGGTALSVLSKLSLPVSIMYPLTTLVLGLMLTREHGRTVLLDALAESERSYLDIFANVSDLIYRTDRDGRVTFVSPSVEALLGYTQEEMLGRVFREAIHADPDHWEKLQGRLKETGQVHNFELQLRHKDGALRWVWINAHFSLDANGGLLGIEGILRDITPHIQTEQALRDSKEQLQSIIKDLPALVCRNRPDGTILFVNHAYCEYFGMTQEQLVGANFYDLIPEDERALVRGNLAQLSADRPLMVHEHRVCAADGSIRYHRWTNRAICDDHREVVMMQAYGEDVTERKRTEQALRRSQKMDAIGQLTGGIAHDFNNILGIILGNVDLLKREISEDQAAFQRIDVIGRTAQRAADLTRQLLGFSRPQSNRVILCDLNRLIKGMGSLIARSVTPEVKVNQHLCDDPELTEIDPGEFEDALLNLIINARDAMPNGGELTLETRNCVLDEEYCSQNPGLTPGAYVQLAVSDNGKGMAPEIQEQIFEPFFTTKPSGKGTGLGLAMVFGFVKRSAGSIKVYSEPGIGTTFRIYLPRAIGRMQSTAIPEESLKRPVGGNETVLVVDDETNLLDLARVSLEALGYRVLVADTPQQALEILAAEPVIDLLFSDVVMPGGINGYELADRASVLRPGLKVLLTSGYTEKAMIHNGQARFNANLLNKPYTQDELAQRIDALFREAITGTSS